MWLDLKIKPEHFKMKKIIPILILTFLIFSCHQKQPDKSIDNLAGIEDAFFIPEAKQASNAPLTSVNEIKKPQMAESKIIKDGRLGLRVKELEKTKQRVDTLVIKFNGYYANESLNNTDWESSYSLKVRIPGTNFENFISEIEAGDGEILYKEINARDVTDQFIDLETRLDNKRNYLKRYNDLLLKANTVKEILEIEEKIRGLEEEIESTTGRLKYLSNLVDYSTLDSTHNCDFICALSAGNKEMKIPE